MDYAVQSYLSSEFGESQREANPGSAAFLVRCIFDGPCIIPTDRLRSPWFDNSHEVRDDRGKFLLLTIQTQMFRHYQPRAEATGTLLDATGAESPAFSASGLYDWDGMVVTYLPFLAFGWLLSAVLWLLDLAWAAFKKHILPNEPDEARA